jgi:hypothetical protein
MKKEIDKIIELLHGSDVMFSKRYVEIYKKPTGYHSLDQMITHIKDCSSKALILIDEFNKKYNKDFYKDFYEDMEYLHRDGSITSLKDALEYERQQYIKTQNHFKTIKVKTFDI